MRPFDLDQLRSLVAVLDAGSLSGAAPRLHRSPSALSEQIQKLEVFAGVPLLRRGKKGVSPTPAGERLLVHAREMLAASERALEDVRGLKMTGELRIAVTDYFRPNAIADVLRRLRARYPELRLHVTIRPDVGIEEETTIDFDIGVALRIGDALVLSGEVVLRKEALVWVTAADLGHQEGAPLPLLVLPGCPLRRHVRRVLEDCGLPYFAAHSASGVAGLQSALVAGLGLACLNTSAVPTCVAPAKPWSGLPPLPDVHFVLLPPRAGEVRMIGEVRDMLASELA